MFALTQVKRLIKGERETDRQTETETERQRQTDRQTERIAFMSTIYACHIAQLFKFSTHNTKCRAP